MNDNEVYDRLMDMVDDCKESHVEVAIILTTTALLTLAFEKEIVEVFAGSARFYGETALEVLRNKHGIDLMAAK